MQSQTFQRKNYNVNNPTAKADGVSAPIEINKN